MTEQPTCTYHKHACGSVHVHEHFFQKRFSGIIQPPLLEGWFLPSIKAFSHLNSHPRGERSPGPPRGQPRFFHPRVHPRVVSHSFFSTPIYLAPGIGVVLSHFKQDKHLSRGAHAWMLHYLEISHESPRRFSHKALSITNMVPTGCDTDHARSDMFFPVSFLSCEKLKSTRK